MQPRTPSRTVLVASPSADLYGSDLQMLESVAGLREQGWRVVVAVPRSGPLVRSLLELGVEVRLRDFPVLRRSAASAGGMAGLAFAAARALPMMRALLREERPALVYVNTLTLPWWLVATRGTGIPTVCHAHEAEAADAAVVQRALAAPLFLADTVVVNSRTTEETVCASAPRLRRRTRLVYNGVAPPPDQPQASPRVHAGAGTWRLVVVGRLSQRKAPDTALDAVALLRARGRDVELEVCGTPGPGQEDFAARLEARAAAPDLRDAVRFVGYASPIWPVLARADVLLAPSLGESFGNAVVEGQLARRPVVATAVQGHTETVEDGVSGLLVPLRDPVAMAAAVERVMDEPGLAVRLADGGRQSAGARFSSERYRSEIAGLAAELTGWGVAPALDSSGQA